MKIIDPGHIYDLQVLDHYRFGETHRLVFVKREGDKFPGNVGHYAGTNMQEVLRAIRHRLGYLNNQIPDPRNLEAMELVERTIFLLEERAAERHGRMPPTQKESVYGSTCQVCGHVGHTSSHGGGHE